MMILSIPFTFAAASATDLMLLPATIPVIEPPSFRAAVIEPNDEPSIFPSLCSKIEREPRKRARVNGRVSRNVLDGREPHACLKSDEHVADCITISTRRFEIHPYSSKFRSRQMETAIASVTVQLENVSYFKLFSINTDVGRKVCSIELVDSQETEHGFPNLWSII